ncbi:M42 family metallopeptidase [Tissierella sp. Yu-01]|uniref:M42 family metallopeptidase n=1 Tax=Tissierella sp. Yu-01 TaxID=3035694 RepID=UPI00240DDD13|nr:M42 family metallopeptidase [Tissierella sp. Yu-01]WFA09724.1 M42 family metallopeptidase [Tissierella sp. Yu-01]
MNSKEFLEKLSNNHGVSGFETSLNSMILSYFKEYSDRVSVDKLGNIISLIRGSGKDNVKIMLAAHMDEIGFIVKDIEDNGFLRFTNIGGIDSRTILGQEVIVHGNRDILGVIGAKPPHLQSSEEQDKAIKMDEMIIDVGMTRNEVEKVIKIGDSITINRKMINLLNNRVAGKALDNRAGVTVLYECMKELSRLHHEADVYFVCTTQEEVTMAGALTSSYEINPDFGITVDVGFGTTPELHKSSTIGLGEGPGITLGGNIHPGLRKKLVKISEEYNIPYQMEITPGPTGTDARAIQINREGIPALVLSIPLRYMHTSVEVLDMKDVKNTAKLLAFFISSISNEELEGLLCY